MSWTAAVLYEGSIEHCLSIFFFFFFCGHTLLYVYGYVPVFRAICVRGVRTLNYAIIPKSAQSNGVIILRAMTILHV